MSLPLNTTAAHPEDPTTVARYHMIEQQIRPWDVSDSEVLDLLARLPREEFVPAAYRGMAFMDMEIPLLGQADEALRQGHCMLAPRIEARLLQDLQVQPTDRVLEVGTATGYITALLAKSSAQVYSVDINPDMTTQARRNLQKAGIGNATLSTGDGLLGLVLPHRRQPQQHFCLCRPLILREDLLRVSRRLRKLPLLKGNHPLNQQRILITGIVA